MKRCRLIRLNFQIKNKMSEENKTFDYHQNGNDFIADVSGSSIKIPKPSLKFEGLDNISIIGEKDIPLSELFELHLKLENYLKSRPETIINCDGVIVGFKNYR